MKFKKSKEQAEGIIVGSGKPKTVFSSLFGKIKRFPSVLKQQVIKTKSFSPKKRVVTYSVAVVALVLIAVGVLAFTRGGSQPENTNGPFQPIPDEYLNPKDGVIKTYPIPPKDSPGTKPKPTSTG